MSFLYSSPDDIGQDRQNHPYKAEFLIGLLFVFLMGYFGIQKISQVDLEPIKNSLCSSGFQYPFLSCNSSEVLGQQSNNVRQKSQTEVKQKSLIIGMNHQANASSLRTQFSFLPNLSSALKKVKWNKGDEQDAVRFLSVITALENGRQGEPGISSSMSSILEAVWNKYPDIVAASHCLDCSRFYRNVLKPYFKEGTKNTKRINQIAAGHPRFLQAIYASGQLSLDDVKATARLQAELLSSEHADPAIFIGDILLQDNDLESLHHWSSKGWNGSYALGAYPKFTRLPQNIIVDAWKRGVLAGADNAELTRYLVSTGYRPALRWLLWVHAGNLSYFKNTTYQAQKDTYNDLILSLHIDFPAESKGDLTGFYSKHWKNISWNKSKQKWVFQKS